MKGKAKGIRARDHARPMPAWCCTTVHEVCGIMRSVVSHNTVFKIANNTVSDLDSSWEERADEGPINPIEEGKRLGANLPTPEKAKIDRESKK